MAKLLQQQRLADDKVSALSREMRHIFERAITSSRQAELEAREETVREHILRALRTLRRTRPKVTVDEVVEKLRSTFPIPRIVSELQKLKEENVIETTSDHIEPDSHINLIGLGVRPIG